MKKSQKKVKSSQEYHAVGIFLESQGILPIDSRFEKKETSTDYEYKHGAETLRFQVTTPHGEIQQLLRDNYYAGSSNAESVIDEVIVKPLEKKHQKYRGSGVADVILLIHVIIEHPFLEGFLSQRQDTIGELSRKAGFKSVYLVSQVGRKAIRIS